MTTLNSITGPEGKETEDWKRIKLILAQIENGLATSKDIKTVEEYMKSYAGLIEEKILSKLIPVSARAMAMLIIGLWAREDGEFSFSKPETRAKSFLLFSLLVNSKQCLRGGGGLVCRLISLVSGRFFHTNAFAFT